MKTTTINNCTLYLADYRDVLPLLGKITAVVADPPYGNDYRQKRSRDKLVKPDTTHAPIVGNAEPFDPAPLLTLAPTVVLWGANYYADRLPANGKWLAWDKRENTTPDDGADVELAWTNLRGVSRMHRQLWRGICRRGEENISRGQRKLHPNQKPAALMDWCLQQAGITDADTVGLNQKDKFVLAVVVVDGDSAESVNYVPMPFTQEPDWAEASKNLDLGLLLGRALVPKVFHG